MNDEPALRVSQLCKSFRAYDRPGDQSLELLTAGLLGRHREVPVLTDLSFSVQPGEAFGIIGHSGSGKTTLLSLLSGMLIPTSGTIVRPLLTTTLVKPGAGFDDALTGRKNLARILNLLHSQGDNSKRQKWIIDFCEFETVIDQPVRTYSSRMQALLGFTVAISGNPDLLLIDESIPVGDRRFREKCHDRIAALLAGGTAVVLASHKLNDISRWCGRALLLEHGICAAIGPTAEVVARYKTHQGSSPAGDESDEFLEPANQMTASDNLPKEGNRVPPAQIALLGNSRTTPPQTNLNDHVLQHDETARTTGHGFSPEDPAEKAFPRQAMTNVPPDVALWQQVADERLQTIKKLEYICQDRLQQITALQQAIDERDPRQMLRRLLTGDARAPTAIKRRRHPASIIILSTGDPDADVAACRQGLALLRPGGSCFLLADSSVAKAAPGVDRVGWPHLIEHVHRNRHGVFLLIAAGDEIPPGTLDWLAQGQVAEDAVVIGRAAWGTALPPTSALGYFARTIADLGRSDLPMRGLAVGAKTLRDAINDALAIGQPDSLGWRVLFQLFRRRCRVVDRTLAVLDARVTPTCWPKTAHPQAWREFQRAYPTLSRWRRALEQRALTLHRHTAWPTDSLAEPSRWAPNKIADPPLGGNLVGFRRTTVGLETWLHDPEAGYAGALRIQSTQVPIASEPVISAANHGASAAVIWIRARLTHSVHANGDTGPALLIGPETHALALGPDDTRFLRLPADAWNLPTAIPATTLAQACWLGSAVEEVDDGVALLRRIGTMLVPGGRLFLNLPNLASTAASKGFAWHAWHDPVRRRLISPHWLRLTAPTCGFALSALTTYDVDGASRTDELGEWLVSEWTKV